MTDVATPQPSIASLLSVLVEASVTQVQLIANLDREIRVYSKNTGEADPVLMEAQCGQFHAAMLAIHDGLQVVQARYKEEDYEQGTSEVVEIDSQVPHQRRVLIERNELVSKLRKLQAFIGGDVYQSLDQQEQKRLGMQQDAMSTYADILNDRIKAFDLPAEYDKPEEPVFETKNYSDGSSAPGVAPLPDQSPAQQDAAEQTNSLAPTVTLEDLGAQTGRVAEHNTASSVPADWWDSLTPDAKDAFLKEHPGTVVVDARPQEIGEMQAKQYAGYAQQSPDGQQIFASQQDAANGDQPDTSTGPDDQKSPDTLDKKDEEPIPAHGDQDAGIVTL